MRPEQQATPDQGDDAWIEQWHRGEVDAPRGAGQSAAEWQEDLFDELVRRDPVGAFGQGVTQAVLWERRIELAREYAVAGKPTLDVGCGNGIVSRAVAEIRGDRVVGIDVSGECIRYAAEHNAAPSVEYRHDSVESFEPEAPFGLVTMYEVLEHVDNPVDVLRRVHGFLAPGGHVIISTPNRSSLNRRIKQLPGIRRLYGRFSSRRPDEASEGHVEEYHYEELVGMVRDAGLELTKAHGVVLLMPFPAAIKPLAKSRRFARLNVRSGDWYPRLAGDLYLVARRPA